MNETKYTIDEIKHLGYEIVAHMRRCGSVSWAVWDEYTKTENFARYAAIVTANPGAVALF